MEDFSYGPDKINLPSYNGFSFGIVKFDAKDDKLISNYKGFHGCREGLIGTISSNLANIETDKTHMLFRWDSGIDKEGKKNESILANKKWAEKSIKLLHIYEKIAGWPLTKPYKVKTDNGERTLLYYFLGSRRWVKAPYLLSLYILLVRLCKLENFDNFKTHDDLIKIVEDISKRGKSSNISMDERHALDTIPYWKTIIGYYSDLFRKKKIEYYWSTDRLSTDSYVSYEGITCLSVGNTNNRTLYKEFMEFHKKGGK